MLVFVFDFEWKTIRSTGSLEYWLVTEYYPGSLRAHLEHNELDIATCLRFCRGTSSGLQYLHSEIVGSSMKGDQVRPSRTVFANTSVDKRTDCPSRPQIFQRAGERDGRVRSLRFRIVVAHVPVPRRKYTPSPRHQTISTTRNTSVIISDYPLE